MEKKTRQDEINTSNKQLPSIFVRSRRDVHLPMEGAPFVFITYWSTVLCVDQTNGQLLHLPAEECFANLVFEQSHGRASVSRSLSPGVEALSSAGIPFTSWTIDENLVAGSSTIRSGERYACAEMNGTVSFSRIRALAWEMFARVPYEEILRSQVALVPRLRRSRGITRCIHQTFPNDNLPESIQQNIKNLKSVNKNYSFNLWTDEDINDFVYDSFGSDIYNILLKIDPIYGACRADLFRYLCIYKRGGVYLDIKSGASKALDEIIHRDDDYIISQWNNGPSGHRAKFGLHRELSNVPGGEYQQWHVIASAGHPFLERVVEKVLRKIMSYHVTRDGVNKIGVLRVSGPIIYTRAIQEIIHLHPHRRIDAEAEGLVYNAIGDHASLFTKHYTSLHTPIVRSSCEVVDT